MEEDILFGKTRHLYGGLEPSNVRLFSVYTSEGAAHLSVELPKDTVIDGQTLVTFAGATIRRGTADYPKDEFDGDFVMDVTEDGVYVDTENTMDANCYYYSIFPYSDQGVYNRSDKNRTIYRPNSYIFGYDLDQADADPDTRVSYPDDVQNTNYKSAYMDFTAGVFNYGDWPSKAGEKFMPRPCMIREDGTVICYLDQDDYTLCDDGITPSNIATSSGMYVMIEWPKIYTKRWEENGIYHFRCSDVKIDDTWDCWCNYDKNDNEIDHFYTSAYPANISNTADGSYWLRSMTGRSAVVALYGYLRPGALVIGDGWDIDMACDRLLINDLLTMIGKSTDTQSVFGCGTSGANGEMNSKGMFWGQAANYGAMKAFGMERLWSGQNRVVWGLWSRTGAYELKITKGSHDGIKTMLTDYTHGVSGYCVSAWCTPYGLIPFFSSDKASASTYFCDYGIVNWHTTVQHSIGFGATQKWDGYTTGAYALTQGYDVTWESTSDEHSTITGLSFKPTKS